MKILNIGERNWNGILYRLTEAINLHTNHESRQISLAMQAGGHYPEGGRLHPHDMISQDPKELRKWIEWADIVNCWAKYEVLDYAGIPKPKNLIITHTGGWFWRQPARHRRWAKLRGTKKELVTNVCLTVFREVVWMPPVFPVDTWLAMKREHGGKPIVFQSPSKRNRKNTEEIIEKLEDKRDIDFQIVEGVTWPECMRRKAAADIYVGLFGDYGCAWGLNSMEAMCMKIPVIAYIKNTKPAHKYYDCLPYYESAIDDLPEAVDALLSNPSLYNEYAERGYECMKKFHDYPVVAKRFVALCEEIYAAD